MANVVFDEDNGSNTSRQRATPGTPGGITGFLIKKGMAKDAAAANVLLGGVAVALFLIAGFVYSQARTVPAPVQSVDIPLNQI